MSATLTISGLVGGLCADEVLRNPRLVSEHVVDCTSVESIIAAIIKPGMSQREKAEAVYRFVRDYRYHWPAAREGRRSDDYEYGVVYDPVKIFNVYGYGYCFQTGPVLEALWQAAGLEARCVGLTGHTVAEVFYDGAYHYYDAEMLSYFRLPDGHTVASVEQCSRDPIRLVVNQAHPTTPYFPTAANPLVPYESKVIMAGYLANRSAHHYRHDKVRVGHRMDVGLAPGMRYVRGFQRAGQWNYRHKDVDIECRLGYIDPAVGPRSFLDQRGYGNGYLLYQPDLSGKTNEYRAGVWVDRNVSQDDRGLGPSSADRPAWAIFRIRVPYVIVGWPTRWTGEARPVGAAVVSAVFHRPNNVAQGVSVSTDGGRTWTAVWRNETPGRSRTVLDLSEHVVGRYEYLVRFELAPPGPDAAGCRLEQLAIRTNFQCAPMALPAVRDGATRMTFAVGEPTETLQLHADLHSAEGFLSEVYSLRAVRLRGGRLTSAGEEVGEIVYRLEPPRPGTVRSIVAGAGCRRQPFELNHRDDVKIYLAENEPEHWRLIADDDVPIDFQHWPYELSGQAACSAGVRRVYIKFALRTAANAAIQDVRLRMRWQPDGARPVLPGRGVRIEHVWTEGDRAEVKTFAKVLRQAPAEYVVQAGRRVANQFVLIEPVRDERCAWRENDPPIARPQVEPPGLLDPAMRDEMRDALRAIEADPERALPQAAGSRIEWLSSAARIALAMYRSRDRYPLPDPKLRVRADDPAARAVVLLARGEPAGRQAAAEILSGPDAFLKQRLLRQVVAVRIRPLPDELLAGLTDASRWVRLGTLAALRGQVSPTARTALARMARDDPVEALRAEASSVLTESGLPDE